MEMLKTLWTNPTTRATIYRFLMFMIGVLVKQGTIPTYVEGLGEQIGPYIMGGALLIPAGQKNATPPA